MQKKTRCDAPSDEQAAEITNSDAARYGWFGQKLHVALTVLTAAYLISLVWLSTQNPPIEVRVGPSPPSEVTADIERSKNTDSAPTISVPAMATEHRIDINAATAKELETLPGIGPALAQAIVEYRDTYGKYASEDDLLAVSGIGEKKLEAIREYVSIQ